MPKNILLNSKHAIVLSHDKSFTLNDAKVVFSLNECLNYLLNIPLNEKIFMIGGVQTAHLFLENNLLSSFFLTKDT